MLSPQEQSQLSDAMAAVRQRAALSLRTAANANQAIGFINALHGNVDAVVAASEASGPQPECKPGCASCCHARVEVSDPEALHIAAYVRRLPDAQRLRVIERLRVKAAGSEAGTRQSCAFLHDGGLCSIYAIRPAVCRKAHSLSAQACHSGAAEIPQDLSRVVRCEVLVAGTNEAYNSVGLPASRHELSVAVLAALAPAAQDDWYQGKPLRETPRP